MIMGLRKAADDMKSMKADQLLNLKQIGNIAFTVLIYSGNCLCMPPKCTYFEAVCTGYYVIQRFRNWEGNWKDLAVELANAVVPQPFLDSAKLALAAQQVYDALRQLQKYEALTHIPDSVDQLRGSVKTIAAIDWKTSAATAVRAHLTMLLTSPTRHPDQFPQLCAATRADRSRLEDESCALQRASQTLETETLKIAESLKAISDGLSTTLGSGAVGFLRPAIDAATSVNGLASNTLRPAIDGLYGQLDALHSAARIPPEVSSLTAVVSPLLKGDGIDLFDARDQAIALASANEEALREAERSIRSVFEVVPAQAQLRAETIEPTQSPVAAARPPEAIAYGGLVDELEDLYAPFQSRSDILDRLSETKSSFMFFRQFPPLFYKRAGLILTSDSTLSGIRSAVEQFRGWTVGDPHFQNFGIIYPLTLESLEVVRNVGPKNTYGDIDPCGKELTLEAPVKFVMNDPDDGGEGSPLLDVARYLAGYEIFRPGVMQGQSEELFNAYLSGLSGADYARSAVTESAIKAAKPEIKRCKISRLFEAKRNFRERADERDEQQMLSPEELEDAKRLVRLFYRNDAELTDGYKYERLKGGSGANWRWELLAKAPSPNGGPQFEYWIEVKGLGIRPGNFPASQVASGWHDVANIAKTDPKLRIMAMNRYRTTLDVTLGNEAITSFRVLDTISGPALLRYRFKGQGSLKIDGIPDAELAGLARDQLHELGRIHRKGLEIWLGADGGWNSYADAVRQLRPQLVGFAATMAETMSRRYDVVVENDVKMIGYLKGLKDVSSDERKRLADLQGLQKDRVDRARSAGPSDDYDQDESEEIQPTPKIMVREINFQPAAPDCFEQASGYKRNDFEFLSLINVGDTDVDVRSLEFDKGFDLKLRDVVQKPGDARVLKPGQLMVLSRNSTAIQKRYKFPASTAFIESPSVKLSKDGERYRLRDPHIRGDIADFTVSGEWLNPAEGSAESLVNLASLPAFIANLTSPKVRAGLKLKGIDPAPAAGDILARLDLSLQSSWQPSRPEQAQQSARDLVPTFVMFNPPGGKKHDFVLFQNRGRDELDLSQLHILGSELTGRLRSGAQMALVKDAQAFGADYPAFTGRILPYASKLDDVEDDFKLACHDEQAKNIWKYSYAASNWSAEVLGKGLGLKAAKMCVVPEGKMMQPFWQEASALPSPDASICSLPMLGSCGGHAVGTKWMSEIPGGQREFECLQSEQGEVATIVNTICYVGLVSADDGFSCK
ncbi:hypothetical protein [Rhizobium johnstonii]